MLATSREALRRVTTLAFVYRLTGEQRFALRAEAELSNVCSFSDWNPSHFLDTAEMAAAVALGYDWINDTLQDEARDEIQASLVEKALVHCRGNASWRTAEHNWNSVCYAGLALGALVIAEDEPELAAEVLDAARNHNPRVLATYGPDGVYPEGPAYWHYGTLFQAILVEGLRSAVGDDLGLASSPGLSTTGDFIMHAIGPTGRCFNFADCRPGSHDSAAVLWVAREFGRPDWVLRAINEDKLRRSPASLRLGVLAALWWPHQQELGEDAGPPPLTWLGDGEQPIAVFRSAWDDPRGLYLAVKGGRATLNHGHMDAGSFVFESSGVRWAIDLGKVDYHSHEERDVRIWDRRQQGDRWRVPGYRNDFHNTLTIGARLHVADATAPLRGFRRYDEIGDRGEVAVDLSSTLGATVSKATRRFRFDPACGCVVVEDQLAGLASGTRVDWTMLTRARVAISPRGDTVTLSQADSKLSLISYGETAGQWSAETLSEAFRNTPGVIESTLPHDVTRLRWTVEAPVAGGVQIGVRLVSTEPSVEATNETQTSGPQP